MTATEFIPLTFEKNLAAKLPVEIKPETISKWWKKQQNNMPQAYWHILAAIGTNNPKIGLYVHNIFIGFVSDAWMSVLRKDDTLFSI